MKCVYVVMYGNTPAIAFAESEAAATWAQDIQPSHSEPIRVRKVPYTRPMPRLFPIKCKFKRGGE